MSKKRIIAVILMTAFTALLFCSCFYFIGNAKNQFPSATQLNFNLAADKPALKISDLQNLSERISMRKVSFCSELEEAQIRGEAVTAVLTNENYFEIYAAKLIGSGITEEMVEGREKSVVIGSGLALKLFFNTDSVGKTVTLNGDEYKICGVFDDSDSLINRVSSDGKDRVYIPYTCYDGYSDCILNIIAYDNTAPSAAIFQQMGLSQYSFTNLSEKSKVVLNYEHIIFFVLYIALLIIALEIWYKLSRKLISEIRESLKTNYFWKSVKAIPSKYILLLLTLLGIPAVLLFLLLISDFSIYIVPQYLPYDNIFDISYYIQAFTENANSLNRLALCGNTYLLQLYYNTCSVLFFLFVLSCVALLIFVLLLRNSVKSLIKNRKTA